jgi:hypothetical protein
LRIFRVTPQLCFQDFLLIEKPPNGARSLPLRNNAGEHCSAILRVACALHGRGMLSGDEVERLEFDHPC